MRRFFLWFATASLLSLTLYLLPPSEESAGPVHALPMDSAYDLIAEVNALRASGGLPPYNIHPILMQIAQAHAEYQASIGTVTHYSADGSRPFQRALAAGYPVAGDLSAGGFFSENIQSGSGLTAARAVEIWTGDAPHYNTMMSPTLQDVGAGVAVSGGITYYTLDAGLSTGSTVNYTPPSGGGTSAQGTADSAATANFIQPVVTSTPKDDGSVYHEVRAGQALWSIALAYGTTVDEIKLLNRLSTNDIYEGQILLISKGKPLTPTPAEPTPTVTIGVPYSSPTENLPPTSTKESSPVPAPPRTRQSGGAVVGIIVLIALLGAGLGTWLSVRKPL